MMRIVLFLGTNIAIMVVLSIALSIFGISGVLDQQGVGLDLNALLIISAVVGMSGSFISLAISKWVAKRTTSAKVITEPRDATEIWLLETVRQQSAAAGIGMPEVAIYQSADVNAFARA